VNKLKMGHTQGWKEILHACSFFSKYTLYLYEGWKENTGNMGHM